MIKLNNFQWTTTEQEYPSELFKDGSKLYAKLIEFGTLPNNANKVVSLNIPNFDTRNVHRYFGTAIDPDANYRFFLLPDLWNIGTHEVGVAITPGTGGLGGIEVQTLSDQTKYTAQFHILYKKSLLPS
jgi:hypothetical protein